MSRAQLIKEASQIPVGGSEEEAKEKVKQLFKKDNTVDPYKGLSDCEIQQLEDEHERNRLMMENYDG